MAKKDANVSTPHFQTDSHSVQIGMAYAKNQEVSLLDSEDEEYFFSEVFENCVLNDISYDDYEKRRIELDNEEGSVIKELLSTYCDLQRDIEVLLIRKNVISHYTPLGAAAKVTELMADLFFNSRNFLSSFRQRYMTFSDEFKDHSRKLSLATAIDAYKRSELIEEQIAQIRIKVENIISSVNKLMPSYSRPVTETVIQDITKLITSGKSKLYDGYYCEYCTAFYALASALAKHERIKHPGHFELAVYENVHLAIQICDPEFQCATKLMDAEVVGLEQFEILLDPELSKAIFKKMRTMEAAAENPAPKRRAVSHHTSPYTSTHDQMLPSTSASDTEPKKNHPSPKSVMLHQQQIMLFKMFEMTRKTQKELDDYRKKELDEKKKLLENEEKIQKEREKQRSIARRQMKNGTQNQLEKLENANRNNPFPGYFSVGKNHQFLNYLKESKEQQHFPYYWVDIYNVIHCHCIGYPPAKWFEDSGCFRCAKHSTTERKCCLYIPVRGLQKQMFP